MLHISINTFFSCSHKLSSPNIFHREAKTQKMFLLLRQPQIWTTSLWGIYTVTFGFQCKVPRVFLYFLFPCFFYIHRLILSVLTPSGMVQKCLKTNIYLVIHVQLDQRARCAKTLLSRQVCRYNHCCFYSWFYVPQEVQNTKSLQVNTCSSSVAKAGVLSVAKNILTELRSMPGIFGLVLKWASSLRRLKKKGPLTGLFNVPETQEHFSYISSKTSSHTLNKEYIECLLNQLLTLWY